MDVKQGHAAGTAPRRSGSGNSISIDLLFHGWNQCAIAPTVRVPASGTPASAAHALPALPAAPPASPRRRRHRRRRAASSCVRAALAPLPAAAAAPPRRAAAPAHATNPGFLCVQKTGSISVNLGRTRCCPFVRSHSPLLPLFLPEQTERMRGSPHLFWVYFHLPGADPLCHVLLCCTGRGKGVGDVGAHVGGQAWFVTTQELPRSDSSCCAHVEEEEERGIDSCGGGKDTSDAFRRSRP